MGAVKNSIQENEDDFIFISDGKVFTNSLFVARDFHKNHDNVIKAINNISCSDDFRAVNFNGATYKDRQGKERKLILLTKKGFIKLVFGFTGKKADRFQEAYIDKFEEMEDLLKGRLLSKPRELSRKELALIVLEQEERLEQERAGRLLAEKAESIATEKTRIVINHLEKVKPKVALMEAIANSENLRTLKQLGYKLRKYGLGPNKIFDWLRHKGVLTLVGGVNYPTAKYDKHFKTVSKNKIVKRLDGSDKILTFDILFLLPSAYFLLGELAINDGYITLANWSQLDMTDLPAEDLNSEFQFSEIKDGV
jgi:Rha family phage regulatory protein